MDKFPPSVRRDLIWLGNTRKNIQAFPEDVQKSLGDELQFIQFGGMPRNAKPFKGIGAGVFELVSRHNTNAYRAIIALKLGKKIYVLHVFQKKSKRGIETPKPDNEALKRRNRMWI